MSKRSTNIHEALVATLRSRELVSETKISLEYHDEMNPRLWREGKLIPEVRAKLLAFADRWSEFARMPDSVIKDVIMTGGNANYNYTDKSDIDVHLIVDKSAFGVDRDLLDDHLQDKKMLWTLTHHVKIAGCDIEPYAQDVNDHYPEGQGVYSLVKDEWVQKPTWSQRDFKSDRMLKKEVMFYIHLIDRMIREKRPISDFADLRKKLRDGRADAIARNGEFGLENLVFKELRNRGVLDRMNKYTSSENDREMSL